MTLKERVTWVIVFAILAASSAVSQVVDPLCGPYSSCCPYLQPDDQSMWGYDCGDGRNTRTTSCYGITGCSGSHSCCRWICPGGCPPGIGCGSNGCMYPPSAPVPTLPQPSVAPTPVAPPISCNNPSEISCNFYSACVESVFHCGPTGYPLAYGAHFCNKFLGPEASNFSPAGAQWRDKVLICLQQALVPLLSQSPAPSCDELKTAAYESHPACYTDQDTGGVCDTLSVADMRTVAGIVFENAGEPAFWKEVVKVGLRCLPIWASDFVTFTARMDYIIADKIIEFYPDAAWVYLARTLPHLRPAHQYFKIKQQKRSTTTAFVDFYITFLPINASVANTSDFLSDQIRLLSSIPLSALLGMNVTTSNETTDFSICEACLEEAVAAFINGTVIIPSPSFSPDVDLALPVAAPSSASDLNRPSTLLNDSVPAAAPRSAEAPSFSARVPNSPPALSLSPAARTTATSIKYFSLLIISISLLLGTPEML
eukprot:TRINITY_DN13720_c0_g1_i1.p1 TRINITY_DN13720_c0_g1~~TRINITY_DN13720_c0_g1_i1.p1  ORF type:complete len:484 (-),score=27.32 TRINITY_DN13720_c0_g1_i1:35-1486(-)